MAIVGFFARHVHRESPWRSVIAPRLAAVLLTGTVLGVRTYAALHGVPPGDPAAWALPASYAVVALMVLGWGLLLRARRALLLVCARPAPGAAVRGV